MDERLKSSKLRNWEVEGEEKESFGTFIKRMRELNGWSQRDLIKMSLLKKKNDDWLRRSFFEILNAPPENEHRILFINLINSTYDKRKEKTNLSEEERLKSAQDIFFKVLSLRQDDPRKKRIITFVETVQREMFGEDPEEEPDQKLSISRLSGIENDAKMKDGKWIRPKEETVKILAQTLQIPMSVMEAKLDQKPIPWENLMIEAYGEERLMQAREIIEDALFVQKKKEEDSEEGEE